MTDQIAWLENGFTGKCRTWNVTDQTSELENGGPGK